ncbi:MAG TPA: amidase [Burkholderiales bacterium]|nr:amidase [Burkholderiales bacterium]
MSESEGSGAIHSWPVHRLVGALASGEINSVLLVEALLERIARYDARLHAFVNVYADEARAAAAAADVARRAGHAVGPLHGIPVAVKDIVDIEGRVTTGGSKLWAERISPVTATLVRRMLAAGMIILGKTHSVEFAMGSFGTNRHMGTPWNPWDAATHRAPGGSSSGTGVAVAARLAPWGIGTDTGGSVRIPSSWCGIVGLKTTIGRVSCEGVLPLSTTLDTPGPMARSVEDAALLYQVLSGNDPFALLRAGVRGLRLARMPAAERAGCERGVLAAYDAALELLAGLGATIVELDLPRRFAAMGALVGRIIGAEGYSFVGALTDDPSLPLDDDVRPRIAIGRGMSARDYLHALREREAVKREFAAALEGADALLTPTTATVAPPVASIDQSGTAAGFTRPVNLIDWCALALPNGRGAAGMPTSLQIACRGNDEATALRIGWAYEQAAGWQGAAPEEW